MLLDNFFAGEIDPSTLFFCSSTLVGHRQPNTSRIYVIFFVYFCSPYLGTTTRGKKVNTRVSLVYPPRRPLSLGPWHSLCELFCPFLFLDSTWLRAIYSVRINCKAGQYFNKHHLHVGERKLICSRTCRIETSAI